MNRKSVQPNSGVEEAVKGFASWKGRVRVDPFVDFGEGVEEAPRVAGFKLRVAWFAPFFEHLGDLAGGDRFAIDSPDDKIVGGPVGHRLALVCCDPFVEANLRERSLKEIWRSPDAFADLRTKADRLRGVCGACPQAQRCKAGCSGMAYSASGSIYENPYCLRSIEADEVLAPLGL